MYKRFTSPEGYFKSEDTPYIQAYKFLSNSCMHYKFPSLYTRILSSMQVKLPISLVYERDNIIDLKFEGMHHS